MGRFKGITTEVGVAIKDRDSFYLILSSESDESWINERLTKGGGHDASYYKGSTEEVKSRVIHVQSQQSNLRARVYTKHVTKITWRPWPISDSYVNFLGLIHATPWSDLGQALYYAILLSGKNLSLPELTPSCMTLEAGTPFNHRTNRFMWSVDFEPEHPSTFNPREKFLKTSRALNSVYEAKAFHSIDDEPICIGKMMLLTPDPVGDCLILEEHSQLRRQLPVIIAKDLKDVENADLIRMLRQGLDAVDPFAPRIFDVEFETKKEQKILFANISQTLRTLNQNDVRNMEITEKKRTFSI
ncbi:hypothetical protein Tco_1042394 [Tanacetum coccineum]|uniref:Uncharacterized protein n=1 Tax=Tanacetum coccineum TaxID=301880 RepID=A0ABQ5GJP9_9ASTR